MKINFEQIQKSNVILRTDLNDSKNENGNFDGTQRMDAAISTINELISRKNNVVVISHLSKEGESLVDNAAYIKKSIPNLIFLQTTNEKEISDTIARTFGAGMGAVFLLENIRNFGDKLEENNNQGFAEWMSTLGEYFVFDAFSVAHRTHASVVSINNFIPSALGPNANREYNNLKKILDRLDKVALIMGGAKISTKINVIEKFLAAGASVFLGGAMAHPILQKRGLEIGESKTEDTNVSESIISNPNLIVPIDFVTSENMVKDAREVTKTDKIFDIGQKSVEIAEKLVEESEIILWNGPFGLYEKGFTNSTNNFANFLKKLDLNAKFVVVGGGDTLSVIAKIPDFKCSYLSLSGGAMLDFLANGSLPGVDAVTH
jgi:phosphoglycerate kinase